MPIPPHEQLQAVVHGLTTVERDGRSATPHRRARLRRRPRRCGTPSPARAPAPMDRPGHGRLRLGGRYQIEGNAAGEVLGCEPPHRLRLTWVFGEQVSWVEVVLTEADGDPS